MIVWNSEVSLTDYTGGDFIFETTPSKYSDLNVQWNTEIPCGLDGDVSASIRQVYDYSCGDEWGPSSEGGEHSGEPTGENTIYDRVE